MARLCEDRVAIVTGAARGVGKENALLLAKCGAKVLVNDLGGAVDGTGADRTPAQEVADEIIAAGGEAAVNGDDVSSWDGAKAMIDQAISTFGKLDILVNNAGILRARMLVNMTEEEWDSVIQVHLKGTFAPSRHAAATPPRPPASTATSARPTMARPRPASPHLPSSRPANYAASG